MNTYRTAEVAKIIGIHPNTVRMYEEWGLIPLAERKPNGYRIFTDFHVEQLKLARIAFQIEVLQNGLRKKVVETVKLPACGHGGLWPPCRYPAFAVDHGWQWVCPCFRDCFLAGKI